MALQSPIGWLQNAGATNSAQVMRLADGGAAKGDSTLAGLLSGRGGIVQRASGYNMLLSQVGGGNMTVNMEPGVCYVPGTEALTQGGYWVVNDASLNVSGFAAAHATLNRTDTVYIKVNDQVYSGALNNAVVGIATGTPGGAAGSLAGINNALMIGQVTVRAGATSIITSDISNNGRYFAAPGGVTTTRFDEGSVLGTHASEVSIFQANLRWYDASGGAWRPLGIPMVSSLGNVSGQTTGVLAWLTATNMFNRWTGSVWEEWRPRLIGARLRQTIQQTINSSTNTPITFDVEDFDHLNGHSTISNTSRYTCQRSGFYRFSGAAGFAPNASGFRAARLWKNGVQLPGNTNSWSQFSTASNAVIPVRDQVHQLTVGDYVEVIALQNSGTGLLTPNGIDDQATLEVEYLGT